jgi:hypothetical protein
MGCDATLDQPAEHWTCSIGGVCDQPFWINVVPVFDPI